MTSSAERFRPGRTAPDGSPYPDRTTGEFERDVQAMFTHIARRYDWFDHLASLGSDYVWRPRAIWDLDRFHRSRPVARILDFGCGTGDLTLQAARQFPESEVVGVDFTPAMLRLAAARARRDRVGSRVRFVRATVLRLPFDTATFDIAMSAFVVRNVPQLPSALRELRRVQVPGGSLLTLEITEPPSTLVRTFFHAYFDRVVPSLGSAVGSAGPYRYLPESLRHLPSRGAMIELLAHSGYDRVATAEQSMGIVTSYLARAAPES